MHRELLAASELLSRLLNLPSESHAVFRSTLINTLSQRYASYWHPRLHSAHRALSSFPGRLDPVLVEVLKQSRLAVEPIQQHFCDTELIVWVDPGEVAYRMGERGNVVIIYQDSSSSPPSSSSLSYQSAIQEEKPKLSNSWYPQLATSAGLTSWTSQQQHHQHQHQSARFNKNRFNWVSYPQHSWNHHHHQQQQQQQHQHSHLVPDLVKKTGGLSARSKLSFSGVTNNFASQFYVTAP